MASSVRQRTGTPVTKHGFRLLRGDVFLDPLVRYVQLPQQRLITEVAVQIPTNRIHF